MLGDRKILGLCVTKIQDRVRGTLVDEINLAAVEAGFKLVCFNSAVDFYRGDVFDKGAKTVFERMDYDILDGVIICAEHFCDRSVYDEVISNAKVKDIPVVILNGEAQGCVRVMNDCEESFKELVRHVLSAHHVTDPFFMAGRKEDSNSIQRLEYYKQVLAEFGIPFDETKMAYGDYWDEPAMRVTEELVVSGRLPQAIICANDSMAFGVCRKLKMLGYSVPKDVIVTGFDGVPAIEYYYPKLTTCRENWQEQAKTCVKIFCKLFAGEEVEEEYRIPYATLISESCGCVKPRPKERDEAASELYELLESMETHENYLTSETEKMLNAEGVEELLLPLSRFILQQSYLCVGSKFMKLASVKRWEEGKTVVIPCAFNVDTEIKFSKDNVMLPEIRQWLEDDSCYLITAIYSKDFNCGYYAVKASYVGGINYKMNKIVHLANLICNTLLNQFKQRDILQSMEGAIYRDDMTGLPNLKAASKWFQEFASEEANHYKTLSVTIYALPQYAMICENFGIPVAEELIVLVADKLKMMRGRNCFIAKNSESEFLLIQSFDNPDQIEISNARMQMALQSAVKEYKFDGDSAYEVELGVGCTVANAGWTGSLSAFVKYASNEMFLNRMRAGQAEKDKVNDSDGDYYGVFQLLIENNLFCYHYQPIINAKNGEIYGYEALMRTKGGIDLTPLQILDVARNHDCLDKIEHATMFNVLKQYSEEKEIFHGRKVFINTIPNHFLSEEECDQVKNTYEEYLDYVVLEVTEQDSSSDEEMEMLKHFGAGNDKIQIAIDDFGTGHSNIVNLLRYTPQIIKIDRYLISGIENDHNKQMFVKNTIEFAEMNGIKVLAEGVETSRELCTVIELGVDLIQGFYLGRPAPMPIATLEEAIRDEIINENLAHSVYRKGDLKVYAAQDGENVNLVDLALNQYNCVHIVTGEVKLLGRKDSMLNLMVRIADNADVKITLSDVNLTSLNESAIQLGKGSNVEVVLKGYNTFNKNGIGVPPNARLHITGSGNLLVNANGNFAVGIGAKYDGPYGEIIMEHTGRIKVISSGDQIVGVGGGYSLVPITIRSGNLEVAGSGVSVLGIGSFVGDAFIDIGNAEIFVKEAANQSLGIGTIKGKLKLSSSGNVSVISDGERAVGIGSMLGTDCAMLFENGKISSVIHCDTGSAIGSYSGTGTMVFKDGEVTIYGEGSVATGVGSSIGKWTTEITGGILDVKVLSGGGHPFGKEENQVIITGGNVIDRSGDEIEAINAYGQKLHREIKDMDHFEQIVCTDYGEYVYVADRTKEHEILSIYLP